jgi:SAM-dependent methyltransferase
MSLYNLVDLRQHLVGTVSTQAAVQEMQKLQENILAIRRAVPLTEQHDSFIEDLAQHCAKAIALIEEANDIFKVHLDSINQEINQVTHELFSNNYTLEERYSEDANYIREHWKIRIDPDIADIVQQRVTLYTDWKYPALEIGCRDGEWTRLMVAADPLYIMDRNREFLESAANQFPVEYQRRMRPYHLANHNLTMLPQNQFGFVFSWGYFNYVSLDTMKSYLTQIFNILRPGGVFMFSYNDGDSPGGAGMAEQMARAYTPKSVLLALVEGLGFEVISVADHGPAISWLEIKRPGELRTVKAHQVLGEIKRREN